MFDFDWMEPARPPQILPCIRWIRATSSGIGDYVRANNLIDTDIVLTMVAGVQASALTVIGVLGLRHFLRDIPRMQHLQVENRWQRCTVRELAGQPVLFVGLGAVGREIAKCLVALGLEVWAVRRSPNRPLLSSISRMVPVTELSAAISEVDAVIMACPSTRETYHQIETTESRAMRSSAALIIVTRGAIVDDVALISALRNERILAGALEVFETEPLPRNCPLWDLPNVLISPQSTRTVVAEIRRIVCLFAENLIKIFAGEARLNEFGSSYGY